MTTELLTVVTRKGQVTIPAVIRRSLGIKQGDVVAMAIEGDAVTLRRARGSIRDFYQTVPALTPSRTWAEITEIAREEHAARAVAEGRESY
jgi:AbrB family looped-hinge helix DNA binding protein